MAQVAKVRVDGSRADAALDALVVAGADAVELEEGAVLGLFHDPDGEALRARLSELLESHGLPAPEVRPAQMLDWDSVWVGAVRPFRVGPLRFAPGGEPGGEALALDLGAFGSGLHPSTRLCLERLVEHPPRGAVLDVGTGTGILALAALRLGADRAVGIDTAPEAVEVARHNAARNGLADRFHASGAPLDRVPERYDRVLANLLAAPLVEMADAFLRAVAPGGEVSLAGFPVGQADEVARAFTRRGFRRIHGAESQGWARVDLTPPW